MTRNLSNPGASFKSNLTENGLGPLFEGMEGFGQTTPDWSIPDNHVYIRIRALNEKGFEEWQNLEPPYSRAPKDKKGQMAWIYSLHKDDVPALRSGNVSKNLSLEVRSDPPDNNRDWDTRPISDITNWYRQRKPLESIAQVTKEPEKSADQPTNPGKVREPQEAAKPLVVNRDKGKTAQKKPTQKKSKPAKAKAQKYDIEEVKRANKIEGVFKELYPDQPINKGMTLCPFHEDTDPSLQINKDNVYCHSCKESWDVFALVQKVKGVDFKEACQWLADLAEIRSFENELLGNWCYVDEEGNILFYEEKYTAPPPKKKTTAYRNAQGVSKKGCMDGVRRVLYRLPEVIQAQTVILTEGPKDADTIDRLGYCATTNSGGAGGWKSQVDGWGIDAPLKGKEVYILMDKDDAGEMGKIARYKTLKPIAKSVKLLSLKDMPEGGKDITDVYEAYGEERTRDILREAIAEACEPTEDALKEQKAVQEENEKKSNKFMRVLNFVKNNMDIRFFEDQYGDSWTTIDRNGHFENLNLESKSDSLINLIMKAYVDTQQEGVSLETIKQVVRYLSTSAESKRTLYNRFAGSNDKCLIDMGDDDWNVLSITPDRIEILDPKPIEPIFARHGHQEALPIPKQGGSLEELFDFIPIKDPEIRILFKVWIVLLPLGHIQRPLLIILGPPGSGKSTITAMARRIWDPSSILSFALPGNQDNLTVAMNNHAIAPIDNLSELPNWASDDICRAITGAGNIKRKHYSNGEEYARRYMRTLILNGISLPKLKPDLLDRSILIQMDNRLTDKDFRGASDLEERFNDAHPRILGAACNLLQEAMKIKPSIVCDRRPRMVDWYEFGCAVARISGDGEARFREACNNNVDSKNVEIMESEPLYQAINSLLLESPSDSYEGSWDVLRKELNSVAKRHSIDTSTGWPKAANTLSGRLRTLSHNFEQAGIKISFRSMGRDRHKRKCVRISRDL